MRLRSLLPAAGSCKQSVQSAKQGGTGAVKSTNLRNHSLYFLQSWRPRMTLTLKALKQMLLRYLLGMSHGGFLTSKAYTLRQKKKKVVLCPNLFPLISISHFNNASTTSKSSPWMVLVLPPRPSLPFNLTRER